MPTSIDSLQIDINANATKANDAIDRLVGKLDRLTTSLSRMNPTNLNGLANGVDRLGRAMQTMNTVKTADFTRLATNLQRLGSINVSALNSAASSMSNLTRAFNTLGTVSANAQQVGTLAGNLSRLGNASMQRAITNIPQLAIAMNNLMTTLSRSPQVSQNVIQMTNALANLSAQGSRVATASKAIQRGFNNVSVSTTKTKKSFGGLAATFGKFYASYFLIIRALKGLEKSIESTADYIEAFNYFNVALGKIGSDWSHQYDQYGYESAEAYADSFVSRLQERLSVLSGLQVKTNADGSGLLTTTGLKNLGLNIQEITQYASQLASVTNSVGQTAEVSLAAANAFSKLGADMSSLFNIDYSSVMNNLQSGLIGQSRALYRYGIDITNATLQTYAYELGLEKAVSEMTQAEKMQLRMLAILDQSKVSWGDLANTINSPSNMMRQFTNNLNETGMVIGQLFIPLLQKVMPVVNGLTIALKELLVNLAGFLGIELDLSAFGQGFTGMDEDIEDVSGALDDVADSAKKARAGLRAFDELKTINIPDSSVGKGSGYSDMIDLTEEIIKATEEYEKVWQAAYDRMENQAQEFADKISEAFGILKEDALIVGESFFANFDTSSLGVLEEEITRIGDNLSSIWNNEEVQTALEDYKEQALITIGAIAGSLASMESSAAIGTLGGIADALEDLEDFNVDKITSIADSVTDISAQAEKIAKSIKDVWKILEKDKFQKVVETITKIADVTILTSIENLVGVISDLFSYFTDPFAENVDLISEAFDNLMGIVENLLGPAETLVDIIAGNSKEYEDSFIHKFIAELTGKATKRVKDILEDINKRLELIEKVTSAMSEFYSNAIKTITEKLENGKKATEDFIQSVQDKIEPLVDWFNEHIVEPIVKVFNWGKDTIVGVFQGLYFIVQAIWKYASGWFSSTVITPIVNTFSPIVEKISGFFSVAWTTIKSIWGHVSGWFNDNVISKVKDGFSGMVSTISMAFVTVWASLKSGVANAMNTVLSKIESALNSLIDGINKVISGFNKVAKAAANFVGQKYSGISEIGDVKLPRVSAYALGGFPEDGWFRASHGEIMGQFDNGQSVVANNMQITEGISVAVQRGNQGLISIMSQELAETRRQNEILMDILAKETGISAESLFESVRDSANSYTQRTGNPAFSW